MTMPTTMQYTETNLVGNITASISSTATTITGVFKDKVTQEQRDPLTTTKLYGIDKGSATQPNPNYEIILAGTVSSVGGVTTLSGCTRGLAFSGISLTGVSVNRKAHSANAEIGCIDLHYLWATIVATLQGVGDTITLPVFADRTARDSSITSPSVGMVCYVIADGAFYYYIGIWVADKTIVFANAAARDAAIPSPQNGMSCYLTAEGYFTDRAGGAWVQRANGATPNASTTVAGKTQESTIPQNIAGTEFGSTGAPNFLNPIHLKSVSTGAADEGYVPRFNADGKLAPGFVYGGYATSTAGETLAAGDWVYVKASDGFLYKGTNATTEASAIVGVIITGGTSSQTVTYQYAGIWNTTGLSDGSVYYLGTGGAITNGVPAFDSSSVIPVRIGTAHGTTKMVLEIQRLPRRVFSAFTVNSATDATKTVTVGFPISYATFTGNEAAALTTSTSSTFHLGYGVSYGYYDPIVSTQKMVAAGSVQNGLVLYTWTTTGSSPNIVFSVATNYVASVDGSNNIILTRAANTTGQAFIVAEVFERL